MTVTDLSSTQVNRRTDWGALIQSDRPLMRHCVGMGYMLQNTEVRPLQRPWEHFSSIFKSLNSPRQGNRSAFSPIGKIAGVLRHNIHLWRRLAHYNYVFTIQPSLWNQQLLKCSNSIFKMVCLESIFFILKNTSVIEMSSAKVKWT